LTNDWKICGKQKEEKVIKNISFVVLAEEINEALAMSI
jgi:hypothetical protein